MFAMFRQFFAMFSSLFSAGQRSANALDILAGSLEDTAKVGINFHTLHKHIETVILRDRTYLKHCSVSTQFKLTTVSVGLEIVMER
mgnify:CR=1 FL=1